MGNYLPTPVMVSPYANDLKKISIVIVGMILFCHYVWPILTSFPILTIPVAFFLAWALPCWQPPSQGERLVKEILLTSSVGLSALIRYVA